MTQSATTPFTIITGFLGAGKTTLLNHVLCGDHGRRLAVIVNEFGAVNIDRQLIARHAGDGVVELTNGCVCCTVREDLRTGIHALLDSRRRGELGFDHIVMETTGLAKVGPIIQTLSSKSLKDAIHLGGVVTVVDASNILTQLDDFDEAGEQIGMADLLLLNKTDLVDEAALSRLTARLSAINGMAQIKRCQRSSVDVANVLKLPALRSTDASVFSFDVQSAPGRPHASLDQVRSFVVQLSEPLDQGQVQDWFSYVIMRHTERLLRYKGILNIHGLKSRVILQGVHSLIEVSTDRDWGAGEARKTTLVFIGKDLPEKDIREGLRGCFAVEQPAAQVIERKVR
jgi:G3E family GTPase